MERLSTGWTDPLGIFAISEGTLRQKQDEVTFGGAPIKSEGGAVVFDPHGVRWYLQAGSLRMPRSLKRVDGARVMFMETYDSRERMRPTSRNWVAAPPDSSTLLRTKPMGRCAGKTGSSGFRSAGYRRRWKTPYAAMAAIDKEFPCSNG